MIKIVQRGNQAATVAVKKEKENGKKRNEKKTYSLTNWPRNSSSLLTLAYNSL